MLPCPLNLNPLKPPLCVVKLGFTGVNIVFLTCISALKRRCSILVRTASNILSTNNHKMSQILIRKWSFHNHKIVLYCIVKYFMHCTETEETMIRTIKIDFLSVIAMVRAVCSTEQQHRFSMFHYANAPMHFFKYFSYFAENIDCGHTLEPPQRGGSNEYPQFMF